MLKRMLWLAVAVLTLTGVAAPMTATDQPYDDGGWDEVRQQEDDTDTDRWWIPSWWPW